MHVIRVPEKEMKEGRAKRLFKKKKNWLKRTLRDLTTCTSGRLPQLLCLWLSSSGHFDYKRQLRETFVMTIFILITLVVTCIYTCGSYYTHYTNVNSLYRSFVRHSHCQKLVERYLGPLCMIFATFCGFIMKNIRILCFPSLS